MKAPNPEDEVENIMKIVDLNDSGVIDYMGFSHIFIKISHLLYKRVHFGYDKPKETFIEEKPGKSLQNVR